MINSGVQTIERAIKRKDEEFERWNNLFEEIGVEFMDDEYVESYMLKIAIDEEMVHIEKDIRDKLFLMMTYDG